MILIQEVLISEDVIQESFACDLGACKGACCVEGDYGAPLTDKEVHELTHLLSDILPYLPPANRQQLRAQGHYALREDGKGHETSLMPDGACVFMGRDALGITFCGIERAHAAGDSTLKKPKSCHLYPIREIHNELTGFIALNYDRWDICSAACTKGDKEKIRVYEFVKEALINAYGKAFYEELEAAAENYYRTKK